MFYGVGARSQSDEYPRHLQEKIYKMIEFMQGPTTVFNFPLRVIKTLNLAWQFDKKNFPKHIYNNFKRVVKT
jgi:hypothetical protein